MKLYFAPGACSLSPHIALREAGLPFEAVKTDLRKHQLVDDGRDYYPISPKGYVPLLELDDGQRLTEGPAIVQYIADLAPDSKLAPPAGTMERYKLMEWLGFINSEVHKGFGPLFNPAMPEEAKALSRTKLGERFRWLDGQLDGHDYLMGSTFTVADAYLFTVGNWAKPTNIDLTGMPNIQSFMARVAARPAVQAAMKAEGLLQ